ncbi:MAG: hypothetical protein ACLFPO_03670 [Spirochaetaceae bacterium]
MSGILRRLLGRSRLFLTVLVFVAALAPMSAQDAPDEEAPTGEVIVDDEVTAGAAALPAEFSGIALGMDIDTVKERLRTDPNFSYRGDPDVTLTPDREQRLIEVEGILFVERAFFQFEEEELFIIILQLNGRRLDYFTMFSELEAKYGEPAVFEPSQVVWESEEVRMTLEKPLTVKYVSRPVFDALVASGEMERSQLELSREEFLEQF